MVFGRENSMIYNNHLPFIYYSPIIRQPVLLEVGILVDEENFRAFSHEHSGSAELVLAVQGNGFVHANGKELPFNSGDIFIVNPGVNHFEDFSHSGDPCILYMCQFSMLQLYHLPAGFVLPKGIPEVLNTGDLMNTFTRMFKIIFEESCSQSFGYECILYTRLESLILYLYRLYRSYLPRDSTTETSNIAVTAKMFIDQHIHNNIGLNDICEALSISNSYLCHEFNCYYHLSPIQYLIGRRVNEAMQMLISSNLPIKEIADKSGFNNISNFNNHFRQQVGICPSKFRENRKNKVKNTNHWTNIIK